MPTSPEVKKRFPIGTRITTGHDWYMLKGMTFRRGVVVGYCDSGGSDFYVRVSWDGWKPASNQAVDTDKFTILAEGE